jgi:hypothetical protein
VTYSPITPEVVVLRFKLAFATALITLAAFAPNAMAIWHS